MVKILASPCLWARLMDWRSARPHSAPPRLLLAGDAAPGRHVLLQSGSSGVWPPPVALHQARRHDPRAVEEPQGLRVGAARLGHLGTLVVPAGALRHLIRVDVLRRLG